MKDLLKKKNLGAGGCAARRGRDGGGFGFGARRRVCLIVQGGGSE